jgi:hypothetical protein
MPHLYLNISLISFGAQRLVDGILETSRKKLAIPFGMADQSEGHRQVDAYESGNKSPHSKSLTRCDEFQ